MIKTHCKREHEFTPENTYVHPRGTRVCKTCRYQSIKKFKSNNTEYYAYIQRQTIRDRKIELVEYKGGACVDCKQYYHPCVYHFDHRDPLTKSFSVCEQKNKPMEELKKEADKCDLVCANCHAMRTYGSKAISAKMKLTWLAKEEHNGDHTILP